MFHCFNISRHISISVLFFIISVSCFVGYFCRSFENNYPGGGVLARFFCPRGRGLALFCLGNGEFALSKHSPGVCPGGDGQAWNWLIHKPKRCLRTSIESFTGSSPSEQIIVLFYCYLDLQMISFTLISTYQSHRH